MKKIFNLMLVLTAVAYFSATLKADPVVKPKDFYSGKSYTWTNANGGTVTSNLTDEATDPRQIMALLKYIYTNKEIPGILQCGYTSKGVREGTIDYDVKANSAMNKAYGITAGNYTPNEEGYTTLIVKVKDSWTPSAKESLSQQQTLQYVSDAIESVQLLTEGLYMPATDAAGNKNVNPGVVYRMSGSANRFFFISKGRGRTWGNNYGKNGAMISEYAPFNGMFEEYSPVAVSGGKQIENFYEDLVNGKIFKTEHDCSTVTGQEHYFCMMGTTGTKKFDVTDLLVTIPDYRLWDWSNRDYQGNSYFKYTNYNKSHAPSLGLYGIQLKATATPTDGDYYKVTLAWTSSLNEVTGNEVNQRFLLWVRDEDGSLKPLTGEDGKQVTVAPGENFEYSYNEAQTYQGREITYVVSGQPTDAQFVNFKEVYSNNDKVTIPGLDPDEGLRIEIGTESTSDYDLATETNHYKNLISIDHSVDKTHVKYTNLQAGSKLTFYRYDVNHSSEATKIAELEITGVDHRSEQQGWGWNSRTYYYNDYKYNLSYYEQVDEQSPKSNITGGTYSMTTNSSYSQGVTDEVDFDKFGVGSFYDEFSASTAANEHPASYEYMASFSGLGNTTQTELHSSYSKIKVHKTEATLTDKAITMQDVENDNVCSERIHINTHDASPAIQFSLDQDLRIAEYSLNKVKNQNNSEMEEIGLAQRLPSWDYAVYENGKHKQNVSQTEEPVISDASAKVGRNEYVPVIKTYRNSDDGTYNTYGAPIVASHRLMANLSLEDQLMSTYVFSSKGKKGRYYQAVINIAAEGTDNYEIVKYRVWRLVGDRAMEVEPDYMARLNQDGHPIVIDSDDEGEPTIDETHNDLKEFTVKGQGGAAFLPMQVNSNTIRVIDTFGASDVTEDGDLTVSYIVRLYAKPATDSDDESRIGSRAGGTVLAKEYYIGESTINVTFEESTPTGIFDVVASAKTPASVEYVNLLGQKSSKPFSGLNVVITTYTDGTQSTAKRTF